MPKLHYSDIPKFTGIPNYRINVTWSYLEESLAQFHVDLEPDFQRAHVWTEDQQRAYVEFRLREGMSGKDIFLNNPDREHPREDDRSVVVDGKQRITAALRFVRNELPVFGGYYHRDIEGVNRLGMGAEFYFHINNLKTRAEVLNWYLELNTGGVLHTPEELDRVRALLDAERLATAIFGKSKPE